MPRSIAPFLVCALFAAALGLPGTATAQDLATAESLLAAGRLEEARRMATTLLAGGLEGAAGIEALDILASVAIAEGDYETATLRLRAILAAEPAPAAARDASDKLRLIGRLVGEPESEAEPAPEPVDEPEPAPEPAPPPTGTAMPPAPAERPSRVVLPETVTAPQPISPLSGLVLLAGDGEPVGVIEDVVALFADHLVAAGVEAEVVPSTVWWRRGLDGALPDLLATVRASEAASVLFVDMSFGYREKLRVICVGADGKELWTVAISGGSGYTDHRPHDRYNEDLIERLFRKLDKKIGGPGLPAN